MADEVPDIYCDGVQVSVTPFDLVIQLQRKPHEKMGQANSTGEPVGCVRMSLEQAKAFCILLNTSLHSMEEQMGTAIPIHPNVRNSLGISKNEDW